MGREVKRYLIGALVSATIHCVIFFVPAFPTPALLVREIPGSIEVSLGAHQEALRERSSPKTREAKEESKDTPIVEDDTPRERRPDRRGDSSLAIPRHEGNPKPPYPEEARRRGYEGQVRLEVEVLTNGSVGKVRVRTSSGYEVLDRSALETVKDWKFIPARFGTVPVKSTVIVPVTFQLKD